MKRKLIHLKQKLNCTPENCTPNPNACPNTTQGIESVLIPLITVIDPPGTSVFNTAFVFLMIEKHSKKLIKNESIRD